MFFAILFMCFLDGVRTIAFLGGTLQIDGAYARLGGGKYIGFFKSFGDFFCGVGEFFEVAELWRQGFEYCYVVT